MIFKIVILFAFVYTIQGDIPYKPAGEFEIKIDYTFKQRPPMDRQTVEYEQPTDTRVKNSTAGPLPYLLIQIKVISITSQELRIRVTDSNGHLVYNRKAEAGTFVKVDWGYSEDIKDRIVPHEYTVIFLDNKKKPISRIFMSVEGDGTFSVNGEKRGKF